MKDEDRGYKVKLLLLHESASNARFRGKQIFLLLVRERAQQAH